MFDFRLTQQNAVNTSKNFIGEGLERGFVFTDIKNKRTSIIKQILGVISHVQFPRVKCIPTASPFALKLETFLKFVKLPYRVSPRNYLS